MPIHQEVDFDCYSQLVFDALTKSQQFSEFSDAPAEIDAKAGGKFSCFGGMIIGLTIEIISNKRLLQAWRVSDWDEGVYSIVKSELEQVNSSKTKLVFDHAGYPEEYQQHLSQGWYDQYWQPMKKFLVA